MQVPYDLTRGSFKTIPASEETTNTQRFEADSLADETVSGEPVSEDKFPAEQGKYSDLGRKWPAPTPKVV